MKRIVAISFVLVIFASRAIAGEVEDAQLRDTALKLDVKGVEKALQRGANPNALSNTPRRSSILDTVALGTAGRGGDPNSGKKAVQIIEMLFQNGAKLGFYDQEILFSPIAEGNEELVNLFLDNGASPVEKMQGYTPTELAIKYGKHNIYNLLVKRGAIPIDKSATAQLKFIEAATSSNISEMEVALIGGAQINGQGPDGKTALISALRDPIFSLKQMQAILWLLEKGADPNITGESGFRGLDGIPLHIAISLNRNMKEYEKQRKEMATRVIRSLLDKGAKVSAMDSRGKTPLHIAAEVDNVPAAKMLIDEGARVMARDKVGETPLDYAESKQMIQLLKKHGAVEK